MGRYGLDLETAGAPTVSDGCVVIVPRKEGTDDLWVDRTIDASIWLKALIVTLAALYYIQSIPWNGLRDQLLALTESKTSMKLLLTPVVLAVPVHHQLLRQQFNDRFVPILSKTTKKV